MKKKVAYLTDSELDYFVAKAQGWDLRKHLGYVWYIGGIKSINKSDYSPHSNGAQAFELLEEMKNVDFYPGRCCYYHDKNKMTSIQTEGETRKIQICRAYVQAAFGKEVERHEQ